jgi:transcriptional regulator with PAS, ATPase and Fis domain
MRRRAESLANVVIDAAPDPIVVLDQALRVQDLSPRAEGMRRCHKAEAVGRALGEFIPTGTFEEVRDSGKPALGRRTRYRDDLVVAESVVPAEGMNLIVGIMHDVTYEEEQEAELTRLRESAIAQAQEVIHKQMRVAHEIASLLGETTAETKVQLSRLINLMQEDRGGAGR